LRLKVFVLFAGILILNGCASTEGSYNVLAPPKDESQLLKFSGLNVEVQCNEEIPPLTNATKERILILILKHVKTQCPHRFKTINSSGQESDNLQVSVIIKRYYEGNAFARSMLAGLGLMNIGADVILSDPVDPVTKEKIASYEVNKIFAWGGLYGATTRITDIEDGFAQAVAAAIPGKKEEQ